MNIRALTFDLDDTLAVTWQLSRHPRLSLSACRMCLHAHPCLTDPDPATVPDLPEDQDWPEHPIIERLHHAVCTPACKNR